MSGVFQTSVFVVEIRQDDPWNGVWRRDDGIEEAVPEGRYELRPICPLCDNNGGLDPTREEYAPAGEQPHRGPSSGCPTYYDGCNCCPLHYSTEFLFEDRGHR